MRSLIVALVLVVSASVLSAQSPPHVVLLLGESEYGSAETMPAFAERLRDQLGLRTTVLHSKGRELPPLDALDTADLVVMFLRFRTATDDQFARLKKWFDDGKPCVALRTTSHAFVDDKGWFPPFFGGHYKAHAPNGQGTKTIVPAFVEDHELVRGVSLVCDMGHGGTYNAQPLADEASVILLGRTGRLPSEPVAWTYRYRPESRIFYTSLGSRENFERPDFQQLLGNAVLWGLGRTVPMQGAFAGGESRQLIAANTPPEPPALAAPEDATILFDGGDLSAWRHYDPSVAPLAIGIDQRADSSSGGAVYDAARWQVDGRAVVARPGFGDVVTRESFGNYHLHMDVLLPAVGEHWPDEFRGQSGVYLAGRYEIQIADSFGRPVSEFSMGAIHGQVAPRRNASRPAGQWQSLDIYYRHLQDQRPVMSAWLNGQEIHDAVHVQDRTTYGFAAEEPRARSLAVGGGVRYARPAPESFEFGSGEFTIAARFKTKAGGTIAAKCPASGEWKPNSKALFLRGGRLVYDIGWVGQIESRRRYNDGKWHRVLLTHDGDDGARMFVDGALVASREDFTARDEAAHVFKIGAAANDFGGGYTGEISDVSVYENNVTAAKAKQWSRGEVVDMGDPSLQWRAPKAAVPLERTGPVEVAGPIRLQADSAAVRFANVWVRPLSDVDHRGMAVKDAASIERGAHVYEAFCADCHASAREQFAGGLQRGSDPRALYETLEKGFGRKAPMAWLPPAARYDVIHYVRDQLSLPDVDAEYLASLPAGLPTSGEASSPVDEDEWPHYRRMDYGNALHWTYEVADDNIVQKGIAIRLDEGSGGVSRGRAFAVYCQDTMRLAAIWTGASFIDWKGVAFDGSHNSHAHIRGEAVMVAANEAGWANPATGDYKDQRVVGRDGKRYGPLPREWMRFVGRQQIAGRSILEYTIGDATVREMPGIEDVYGTQVFTRLMEVSACDRDLWMRVAPVTDALHVAAQASQGAAELVAQDGWWVMLVPSSSAQRRYLVQMTDGDQRMLAMGQRKSGPPELPARTVAAPAAWRKLSHTKMRPGQATGAYAVDELPVPDLDANPWRSWMRLGGFDFFADGDRAALGTWNGDVWLVTGLSAASGDLQWRRIAAGLFQPLGVRIVDGAIYVGCRDQICVLEDVNGDGETDYYRSFNNDHQVTEHFHEFAMGLQTDAAGNFYYAKSARHALTALVPHHGTLLKVSADGAKTTILANGFRAANGVCVNGDGSFYVTDQEGHWTPKNRINRVTEGGFYGNMFGYHEQASSKDEDMEQPLCWLTNAFDRSPAELLRVRGTRWGLPENALLQLSYGMGRAYLVLEDEVDGAHQGAMVALPIPPFATGVMRGRFHPPSGQLYCCGLYGWSGSRTRPGGFYRVRYVGGEIAMPTAMRSVPGGLELQFGARLVAELANDPESYSVKTWSLRRTRNYGSKHYDVQDLEVVKAALAEDGKTVRLAIEGLAPTMCLEVVCDLEAVDGRDLRAKIHGTLHKVR